MTQVCSCACHPISHLVTGVTGKAGVTGDPLKAQMGSPISELVQPLPDPVHHDVSLRRRALSQASMCRLGVGADPHFRGCRI